MEKGSRFSMPELRTEIRLSQVQKLAITQTLRQQLEILQMPSTELDGLISTELSYRSSYERYIINRYANDAESRSKSMRKYERSRRKYTDKKFTIKEIRTKVFFPIYVTIYI